MPRRLEAPAETLEVTLDVERAPRPPRPGAEGAACTVDGGGVPCRAALMCCTGGAAGGVEGICLPMEACVGRP